MLTNPVFTSHHSDGIELLSLSRYNYYSGVEGVQVRVSGFSLSCGSSQVTFELRKSIDDTVASSIVHNLADGISYPAAILITIPAPGPGVLVDGGNMYVAVTAIAMTTTIDPQHKLAQPADYRSNTLISATFKADTSAPTVTGAGVTITSSAMRLTDKRGGSLGFVETRTSSAVKIGITEGSSGFYDAHGGVVGFETSIESAGDSTRR
jgi:hypothetical protein